MASTYKTTCQVGTIPAETLLSEEQTQGLDLRFLLQEGAVVRTDGKPVVVETDEEMAAELAASREESARLTKELADKDQAIKELEAMVDDKEQSLTTATADNERLTKELAEMTALAEKATDNQAEVKKGKGKE